MLGPLGGPPPSRGVNDTRAPRRDLASPRRRCRPAPLPLGSPLRVLIRKAFARRPLEAASLTLSGPRRCRRASSPQPAAATRVGKRGDCGARRRPGHFLRPEPEEPRSWARVSLARSRFCGLACDRRRAGRPRPGPPAAAPAARSTPTALSPQEGRARGRNPRCSPRGRADPSPEAGTDFFFRINIQKQKLGLLLLLS